MDQHGSLNPPEKRQSFGFKLTAYFGLTLNLVSLFLGDLRVIPIGTHFTLVGEESHTATAAHLPTV